MKVIAKFYWDCGRQGSLDGMFIADKAKLDALIGERIYFGEVLGKHSEIFGTLEEKDITILSVDQEFIEKFILVMGGGTISGYNPLDYLPEDDEEDEEETEAA